MPRRHRKVLRLEGYEIRDARSAFLGEGTYGTVFSAVQLSTGRAVAIKQQHDLVSPEQRQAR